MKHLIAILLLLIGVYAQGQSMYFQVDSTSSILKVSPLGLVEPDRICNTPNSQLSLPTHGDLQLRKWMGTTMRNIFGEVDEETLRLFRDMRLNTFIDQHLNVPFYEYRFSKEMLGKFLEHEESFYRFGQAILSEDMELYFKIDFPDRYCYNWWSYTPWFIYKLWK